MARRTRKTSPLALKLGKNTIVPSIVQTGERGLEMLLELVHDGSPFNP
jgi:hypothetical protein